MSFFLFAKLIVPYRAWAECVNAFFEKNDVAERIDHRSYERQGIEQVPTIHLGVAAFQMEKRGIQTKRGDINRAIEVTNQRLRQLKARICKLQKWLKEEADNTEPPTLADVIQGILSRQKQVGESGRYQSIGNLKAAADMLTFLTVNSINDMAGLEEKVQSMYGKQFDIRDKLKPIEMRKKSLDEHIKQSENYFMYKPIYDNYKQQKPKKQEAYYETHRAEITLFEAAQKHLTGALNGRTTIPTKAWKTEREKLTADHKQLNMNYVSLKTDIAAVEKIRTTVYDIMREESRRIQHIRTQDKEH